MLKLCSALVSIGHLLEPDLDNVFVGSEAIIYNCFTMLPIIHQLQNCDSTYLISEFYMFAWQILKSPR